MSWEPEWAKDPEFQKEMEKIHRRDRMANRLTSWLRHVPVIGDYVASFWFLLLNDGIKTLKPRWGGITFAYLNDGIKPTVWHTWRQMTPDMADPFTGIYVMGAPKSLAQALEWEAKWAKEQAADPLYPHHNILMDLVDQDCDDCGRTDGTHNPEVEH